MMKSIRLTLTGIFLATLLCTAAATSASSQDQPVVDFDALAIKGEALANQDPLALSLRNQSRRDSWRRGFDIGMAIAEGHTAPGPGKDRKCLGSGDPAACTLAVQFSVDRNRYADMVRRGRAIAKDDPAFSAALFAKRELLYQLGFFIGLGAADGQTAPGPGKDATCASLQLPGEQEACRTAVLISVERNRNNAALGATTGTTAGPNEKASQQPSNEIRCRGGQNLIFTTENSKVSSTGENLIVSLLTFEPAAAAAGTRGQGLRAGECAWADRPISGRFLIRFETSANAQLKQTLQGVPVNTSSTAAEAYPDARSIPIYMSDQSHYWSFFGTAPVNNFLTTTANGYWKPAVAIENTPRSPNEPARRRTLPTKP